MSNFLFGEKDLGSPDRATHMGGRPDMPTTLPEHRKPSKIVVWARDGEIAVLLVAFWFMTRHSSERRKKFHEALACVRNARRRRART
jgi:hypothetical protein